MMKILVMSDSHGHDHNMIRVIEREKPFDAFIHLGDSQETREEIEKIAGCPAYMVAGNCDFFTDLPYVRYVELMGHKIMMAHGHRHDVSSTEEYLVDEAKSNGCDLVMYGHTHKPVINFRADGIVVMNPGSISLPRQKGREASYMVLNLHENGLVDPWIKYF